MKQQLSQKRYSPPQQTSPHNPQVTGSNAHNASKLSVFDDDNNSTNPKNQKSRFPFNSSSINFSTFDEKRSSKTFLGDKNKSHSDKDQSDPELSAKTPSAKGLKSTSSGRKKNSIKKHFSKEDSNYYTTSPNNYNDENKQQQQQQLTQNNFFQQKKQKPQQQQESISKRAKPFERPSTKVASAVCQSNWITSEDNMLNTLDQPPPTPTPQQSSPQPQTHSPPPPSPTPKPPRPPPRKPALNTNFKPPRALFCLTLANPVRKVCIRICEYKWA